MRDERLSFQFREDNPFPQRLTYHRAQFESDEISTSAAQHLIDLRLHGNLPWCEAMMEQGLAL